jgi:hypothetical protein
LELVFLVVGAVLGVIADRLYCRFERFARLDVIGGVFVDAHTEGFTFTITNVGASDVPPVRICIYNPKVASVFMFVKNLQGIQLPGQSVEHKCLVLRDKQLLLTYPDFYRNRNCTQLTEKEKNDFVFRLIVENSDKVVYESKTIGNSFVSVFQKIRRERTFECMTFEEAMSIQSRYEPWYVKLQKKLGGKFAMGRR